MALKRIMPCLLIKGNNLVKTIGFKSPNYIGNPINAIKIYNEKEVDEIVILDIFASKEKTGVNFELLSTFTDECFMPLAYGGGVKTEKDFDQLFAMGIEKVIVNSLITEDPTLIKNISKRYGAQAIVASIDYKKNWLGKIKVFGYNNQKFPTENIVDYGKFCEQIGCGEILLYDADRDGTWIGFNHEVINSVIHSWNIPVVVCGGAGEKQDIKNVLYKTGANAAAIGSMAVYQKKGMGVLIGFPNREEIIID